ncbi:MAG: hypothetical protein AAB890_00650 [Patescibacteria group bacterium]
MLQGPNEKDDDNQGGEDSGSWDDGAAKEQENDGNDSQDSAGSEW